MRLWFLGTGAGRPAKQRNVTAAALQLPEPSCGWWLFDAGEATQHKLMELPLKLSKLEAVFITHLHGDHLYGLPGLLSTRSFEGGVTPLHLYGPIGIKHYITTIFSISGTMLDYELIIHELDEQAQAGKVVIMNTEQFTVEAAWLVHRLPCLGFRVIEHDRPGKLLAHRLKELGVEEGPLYGQIKRGLSITLASGEIIKPTDVMSSPKKGRIVTVLGDTSPCDNAKELAKNADLLVHEATFEAGLDEKALAFGHSTTVQAAVIARDAAVKRLVLTHFSSRYSNDELQQLVDETSAYHTNVTAALDLMAIDIDRAVE